MVTSLVRGGGLVLLAMVVLLAHSFRAGTLVMPIWPGIALGLAGAAMLSYRIRSHWAQGLVMFGALVLISLGIRYL